MKYKDTLLTALKWIKPLQKRKGIICETNCLLQDGYLTIWNFNYQVSIPIENKELNCCPETLQLIDVLSKIKNEYIMEQKEHRLFIKEQDKSTIYISCKSIEDYPILNKPIEDSISASPLLQNSLRLLEPICNDKDTRINCKNILIKDNIAIATNGKILVEYWHDFSLPKLMFSKLSAELVGNSPYRLIALGYNENTITFWFENESFVNTCLVNNEIPIYNFFENETYNDYKNVPENLFSTLKQIKKITKNNILKFNEKGIELENGSFFEIKNLQEGIFDLNLLLKIEPFCNKIKFEIIYDTNSMKFYNDLSRGIILGLK